MYRKMNDRPSNQTTPDVRQATEHKLLAAFMQYLASSGPFAEWKQEQAEWELLMVTSSS